MQTSAERRGLTLLESQSLKAAAFGVRQANQRNMRQKEGRSQTLDQKPTRGTSIGKRDVGCKTPIPEPLTEQILPPSNTIARRECQSDVMK